MGHQRYIITFQQGTAQEEVDKYKQDVVRAGGKVTHEYGDFGFAAELSEDYLNGLQASLANGPIGSIEPDGEVRIQN